MNKNVIMGLGALLAVSLGVFMVLRDNAHYRALPPRFEYASKAEAMVGAREWARVHGGSMGAVLGTGSMSYRGFIPAAPEGVDPRSVVVAYYVNDKSVPFADIGAGMLCTYSWPDYPNWVLHQAAERDRGGWVMSGDANGSYDGLSKRMTELNYKGKATAVFVITQNRKTTDE